MFSEMVLDLVKKSPGFGGMGSKFSKKGLDLKKWF